MKSGKDSEARVGIVASNVGFRISYLKDQILVTRHVPIKKDEGLQGFLTCFSIQDWASKQSHVVEKDGLQERDI